MKKRPMQEIVDWLKTVERLAHDLYREASVHFAEDRAFSTFLDQLAQDEAQHFHLMSSAADYLRTEGVLVTSGITLPQVARDQVETPLRKCHHLPQKQGPLKKQMIQFIAEAIHEDPDVQAHFMFCSGGITPERMRFLQRNNLHYLMKPVHLNEVRQMVDTIAQRASQQPATAQGEAYG